MILPDLSLRFTAMKSHHPDIILTNMAPLRWILTDLPTVSPRPIIPMAQHTHHSISQGPQWAVLQDFSIQWSQDLCLVYLHLFSKVVMEDHSSALFMNSTMDLHILSHKVHQDPCFTLMVHIIRGTIEGLTSHLITADLMMHLDTLTNKCIISIQGKVNNNKISNPNPECNTNKEIASISRDDLYCRDNNHIVVIKAMHDSKDLDHHFNNSRVRKFYRKPKSLVTYRIYQLLVARQQNDRQQMKNLPHHQKQQRLQQFRVLDCQLKSLKSI